MFFKKKKVNKVDEVNKNQILAPCDGNVSQLEDLNDGVFSVKMMGDGLVVIPPENAKKVEFVAPISGELVTVFPTKHAYGIRREDGLEILLHIGIDTVNLEGKGFEIFVKQGEHVDAGQKLVVVDVESVRKNAPSSDAIVIVTSGQKITNPSQNRISAKGVLFSI